MRISRSGRYLGTVRRLKVGEPAVNVAEMGADLAQRISELAVGQFRALYDLSARPGHQLDQVGVGKDLDGRAGRRPADTVCLSQLTLRGQPRAGRQLASLDLSCQLGGKLLCSHRWFAHWSLTVLSWSAYGPLMAGSRFFTLT